MEEARARKVGVVGLGRMGGAMLRTLRAQGFDAFGYDKVEGARRRAAEDAPVIERLVEMWPMAEIILLSLPMPDDLEAVLDGPGGLLTAANAKGRLVIDSSTGDPAVTRRLEKKLAAAGHALVDAPVSGGPAGAAAGTLTIMVGGREAAIDRARPVLEAIGSRVVAVGEPGAGHAVKLANNLLVAGHLLLAGEALRLGEAYGVDPAALVAAVNGSSGRSAVTEVNLPRWVMPNSFDSGFSMALMCKDVDLAARVAERDGLPAPLLPHVRARWAALTAACGEDADFNRAVLGEDA